jgi:hypothetical protein
MKIERKFILEKFGQYEKKINLYRQKIKEMEEII